MIVVDLSGMPDHASGARTRLRGWLAAWARDPALPRLALRLARGSRLLDGLALAAIEVAESRPAGGPFARGWRHFVGGDEPPALLKQARVWHSETLPAFAPLGVPAFVTLHDLRFAEPRDATGAPLEQWLPRHVAARTWLPRIARRWAGVVTVSAASASAVQRHLQLDPARVRCIANANVDAEAAPPLPAAAAAALLARLRVGDRPFFVALGHLEPRKGLDLALAALARASGSAARAALVVVGGATGKAAAAAAGVTQLALRLGLGERVVVAGALDDSEVATLLQHAAALLFPSRYEGFGLPIHEALARGCPVVARPLAAWAELPDVAAEQAHAAAHAALVRCGDDPAAWAATLTPLVTNARAPAARTAFAPSTPWRWDDVARALASVWTRAPR